MLGIHELWLFILSGLLLNVTPGPDTAYIVGRSVAVRLARRCGGGARHQHRLSRPRVGAARSAFRRCLMASSTAFTLVKWAGAAYLCFIGIRMLLTRDERGWRKRREAASESVARCGCSGRVL